MKRHLMGWFCWALGGFCLVSLPACARPPAASSTAELRVRITSSQPGAHRAVPAVAWLEPLPGTPVLALPAGGRYTLLQKNRTFLPHLQVVPVGSVVQFPNADPFFHNVFSLFDGKRFDLGLYEAGSSKSVTFSREGVSYIFCNIHPEMSAVIISLSTPLYAIADANGLIVVRNIPPGDYKMNLWVEGVPRSMLAGMTRQLHLHAGITSLGDLKLPLAGSHRPHSNEFGAPYPQEPKSPY